MKRKQAPEKGRSLIERTRQELTDLTVQRNFIELIETVFVYKFPELNFQEVGEMLGLGDLKRTRAYQEAEQAGEAKKQEELLRITVPLLLGKGMTVEEIAQHYQLSVDLVQRFVPQT